MKVLKTFKLQLGQAEQETIDQLSDGFSTCTFYFHLDQRLKSTKNYISKIINNKQLRVYQTY